MILSGFEADVPSVAGILVWRISAISTARCSNGTRAIPAYSQRATFTAIPVRTMCADRSAPLTRTRASVRP